jgi:hypothetical protein
VTSLISQSPFGVICFFAYPCAFMEVGVWLRKLDGS